MCPMFRYAIIKRLELGNMGCFYMRKKLNKTLIYILAIIATLVMQSNLEAASNYHVIKMSGGPATTCNMYTGSNLKTVLTYVNPYYHKDAPIIDETKSAYRIVVSGADGWISKSSACAKKAKRYTTSKVGNQKRTVGGFTKNLNGLNVSRYQSKSNKLFYSSIYGDNGAYYYGYTDLPKGLSNDRVYYSVDGIYYYTNYNTMINDFKASRRSGAANAKYPYFDYYTYVPLRTQTRISGSAMDKRLKSLKPSADDYMSETRTFKRCGKSTYKNTYKGPKSGIYNQGKHFYNTQSKYKVNAGALYGITLNESGHGFSNLARHYKNPFGWGAVDSCPNNATIYKSMADAVTKYYGNISSSYANPIHSIGEHGTHLGNKSAGMNVKYASDSDWGYKNAFNYRRLDEVAGKVDKNRYQIGILRRANGVPGIGGAGRINAYVSASTKAKVAYYYTRYNSSVVIQGTSGDFYKVQNDSKPNAGSVYIPKANIHIANTAVVTYNLNYQKSGNKHYIWGLNTSGQLGNGNYKNTNTKVDIQSRLPKGETIKQVVKNGNNNIFVLTTQGHVYTSGNNSYGQRGASAKGAAFSRLNNLNIKINAIGVSSANRLTMAVKNKSREFMYVGANAYNGYATKWNRTTKWPIWVKKNSKGKIIQVRYYNYSRGKVSTKMNHDSKGRLVNLYDYFYDSKKRTTKRVYKRYTVSNRKINKQEIRYYRSNGKLKEKKIYYYVNGKLKSTKKAKAKRYQTLYNSHGKATVTYLRTYSTKGKLGKASRVKIR